MLRVLIIDDEPAIAQGMKVVIDWEQEGYEIVQIAYHAEQALSWLRENTVDLVLLDVQMPGMSGLEMMQTVVRENLSQAVFIVLSGYNDFTYAQQALRLGCMDYLLKPVDQESLRSLLRRISSRSEEVLQREEEKRRLEESHLEFMLSAALEGRADEKILGQLRDIKRWKGLLWYCALEVIAEAEEEGGEEERALEENLYHLCKEILPPDWGTCVRLFSQKTESYEIGMILSEQALERSCLSQRELMEKLRRDLEEKLRGEIHILAGKKVASLEALSKSFSSCAILRSMTSFHARNSVLIYEEELQVRGSSIMVHKEIIDQILEAVRENDKEKISSLVVDFYAQLDRAGLNSDSFNLNMHYLLFQLVHLAAAYDDEVDQSFIAGKISENSSLGEARGGREHLEAFLLEYASYLMQLRRHVSPGVLLSVEKEIQENFSQNLTLRELGEKYYLNSSYLGQIFHRRYGVSFKDYLNRVRIQAAAELLMTTDQKVASIAEQIGYKDTNYFIRKFIEMKGCTPTRFRREYLSSGEEGKKKKE